MSFFVSKAQLAAVSDQAALAQSRLGNLNQIFERADVRLDEYPAEIVQIFGDNLTENSAGRWTAKGVVGEVYSLSIYNVPDGEKVVFTALKHGDVVEPLTVSLHPGKHVDFTAYDFQEMEAWVDSARTGTLPDPTRHAARARRMAELIG